MGMQKLFGFLILVLTTTGCYVQYFEIGQRGTRLTFKENVLSEGSRDKVALLDLTGIIDDEEDKDLLASRGNKIEQLKAQFDLIAKNPSIKALVLKINSPGGEVTASDIIYHELLELKKLRGIKVVACIIGMAASGAYYVAMAADRIVALPTSITGSIGVIQFMISAEGLLTEKLGIEDQSVKSGKNKDIGSPFRKMNDEQRQITQGIVDSLYKKFLSIVKNNRQGIPEEMWLELADGRIFTADQAKQLSLIDDIGYIEDAIKQSADLAGISNPTVIAFESSTHPVNNFYSKPLSSTQSEMEQLVNQTLRAPHKSGMHFYYLFQTNLGSPQAVRSIGGTMLAE